MCKKTLESAWTDHGDDEERREQVMKTVERLAERTTISMACASLGVPRSSSYRARQPKRKSQPRPTPKRALSQAEREKVRQTLNSERFQDHAVRQVYAALLDEGQYLCSWRTMYRILDDYQEVKERRDQLRHSHYRKPELWATGPNQLWSWDITKLKGPAKWTYYYLYTILDVFSRYVPGWLIVNRESATLAKQLITGSCTKQGIQPNQLTLHADRGSAMISKTVAQLLADLGVTKTHSRPHVSNDNPCSESQFKTMKYRPAFPERFGSIQDARAWTRLFFHWYNHEHHHSGLGLLTLESVHYGQTQVILEQRLKILQAAYAVHPERFVHGKPKPLPVPTEVWINKPSS